MHCWTELSFFKTDLYTRILKSCRSFCAFSRLLNLYSFLVRSQQNTFPQWTAPATNIIHIIMYFMFIADRQQCIFQCTEIIFSKICYTKTTSFNHRYTYIRDAYLHNDFVLSVNSMINQGNIIEDLLRPSQQFLNMHYILLYYLIWVSYYRRQMA